MSGARHAGKVAEPGIKLARAVALVRAYPKGLMEIARALGVDREYCRAVLQQAVDLGLIHARKVGAMNVYHPGAAPLPAPRVADEPAPRVAVEVRELAPGHVRVRFGTGWKPRPAQRPEVERSGRSSVEYG